jgi:hypothetical protein
MTHACVALRHAASFLGARLVRSGHMRPSTSTQNYLGPIAVDRRPEQAARELMEYSE